MRSKPAWLPLEEVIELNRALVAATDEPFSILSPGLLESAWAKPANHWHYGEDDIVTLAVQLLLGIAKNHPFEQGNKRTAFAAAVAFLHINGYSFKAQDSDELGDLVTRAIVGTISDQSFTEAIRPFIEPIR